MNKLFKFFLILAAVFGAERMHGQVTFEKNTTYQQDKYIAKNVNQSIDSGFVLVGYKKISNFKVGFLMKTNKYGDTTWIKHYQRAGEDISINDVKIVENGYLFSCFCRATDLSTIGYPIIIHTDLFGEILWSKKIQDPTYATNSVYENKLILTEDGGFLYFLKRQNSGLFIYKFNLNGDLEWSKNYYNSSVSNYGNIDIIQKEGNYYFVSNSYFVKLNAAGELIWKKSYKIPETEELLFPTSLAANPNGFILGCHFYDDNSNSGNQVCLFNVDTVGNIFGWSYLFSDNENGDIFTITNTSDNGHVITYSTSTSGEFTDYRIIKFDSNGNINFSKNARNWSSSVKETYDKGYFYAYFNEESDTEYFNKTDSLGNTSCHDAYGSGNHCCDFNKDSVTENQVISYFSLLNNSITNLPIQIFRYGQNINTTCTSVINTSSIFNEFACNDFTFNNQTYNESGTYYQVLQNHLGYDSTITLNLTITNINTSITNNSNILSAVQAGGIYQWIDCATNTAIAGATNQTFAPPSNGSYAVEMSFANCQGTTPCFEYAFVELPEMSFQIYPNPFTTETSIVFNIPQTNTKVQLYDVLGHELQSFLFSGMECKINRQDLSASMYLVKITDQNNQSTIRKVILE